MKTKLLLAAGMALASLGLVATMTAGAASAAQLGALTIIPAAGANTQTWNFASAGGCPTPANKYDIIINGTNFPADLKLKGTTGTEAAFSNTASIGGPFPQTPQGFMDLFGTGDKQFVGQYTITLRCLNLQGLTATPTGDTYVATLNFTTPTTYVTVGGVTTAPTTTATTAPTTTAPTTTAPTTSAPATTTTRPATTTATTTAAGATTATTSRASTATTTATGGSLANTGGRLTVLALLGAALVAIGTIAVVTARRRAGGATHV